LSLPPSEVIIVERVCEAYIALAMARQPDDLNCEHMLAEACKRLCPYALVSILDGETEISKHIITLYDYCVDSLSVRKLVLSLLSSVGPAVIRKAYGDAGQTQFRWNNKGLVEQGK
jgi:hypothetical protein